MYFGRMYIFCCKVRKNLILYVTYLSTYSWIAQPVERVTVNHDVAGSNPASGANGLFVKWLRHRPFTAGSGVRIPHRSPSGRLAQLGERLPYKQNVGSSILSSPTKEKSSLSGCFLHIKDKNSIFLYWRHISPVYYVFNLLIACQKRSSGNYVKRIFLGVSLC